MTTPLTLVPATDPVLRRVAEPVTDIAGQVLPHVDAMVELMREHKGAGLSAPQVGIGLRFFFSDACHGVVINPRILSEFGGYEVKQEGCLSFPGRRVLTRRSLGIVAEWTDRHGKAHNASLTSLSARVFQHELDHLNGICLFS